MAKQTKSRGYTPPAPTDGSLLLDTVRSKDLADLTASAIDSFANDLMPKALTHLPVAGVFLSLMRLGRSASEHLFRSKILRFLGPLGAVDPDRRRRMLEELNADPGFVGRVGEHLILLLNRLDSLDKATMMGRAFKAYLEGRVNGAMLQRLNYVIDRVVMTDVPYIRPFAENPEGANLSAAALQGLVNAGLAHVPPGLLNPHVWPIPGVCDAFVDHVLENPTGAVRKRWSAPWPPT